MRTLCPQCATAFRITPDQLRARNGMVRCGQCQSVFNAFDSLIEEAPAAPAAEISGSAPAPVAAQLVAEPVTVSVEKPETPPAESIPEPDATAAPAPDVEAEPPPLQPEEIVPAPEETPEQSAQAVREAGLAALRDLTEAPGYSRWSAGALAGEPAIAVAEETPRRAAWPFVLALLTLVLLLLGQLAYHFRGELVLRLPELRDAYAALDIAIPLPRSVDLVTIEASDLQSDNARGLLVLQATLKNRAAYMQAWPALELTLTDANDGVVVRKVLNPPDYLPPKSDARGFAGNAEVAVKLWLESKLPAAGYRLYVFYP